MGGIAADESLKEIIEEYTKGHYVSDLAEELLAIRAAIRKQPEKPKDLRSFLPEYINQKHPKRPIKDRKTVPPRKHAISRFFGSLFGNGLKKPEPVRAGKKRK